MARSRTVACELEELESPDFFPAHINTRAGILQFVRLTRTTYKQDAFLNIIRPDHEMVEIPLERITGGNAGSTITQHLSFIFHGAYGCSTLLARYCELFPQCLVMREPAILAEMAFSRPQGDDMETMETWRATLRVVLGLLARRYHDTQHVIIKASDACNAIAEDIMEIHRTTRSVFIANELTAFVVSVLKFAERRVMVRGRIAAFGARLSGMPGLLEVDANQLTDAEAAACYWALNAKACQRLQDLHPSRMATCLGERFADDPRGSIPKVVEFFGITREKQLIAEVICDSSVLRYSKNRNVPFEAERRQEHLAGLRQMFRREAEEALTWIRHFRKVLGADFIWPIEAQTNCYMK